MKIDWNKRKEEMMFAWDRFYYGMGDSFVDEIISQEQSMIEKLEADKAELEKKCVPGCKAFYGGEVMHHKDCPYYSDSLSKKYDKLEADKAELLEVLKEQLKMIKEIPCTCDIAYTNRRLIAPDCPKCNVDITTLDNIDMLEKLIQKMEE